MRITLEHLAFPRWRYALAGVLILALVGYFYFGRSSDLGATLTVFRADFKNQVSVSGTVTAAEAVDLGFATNGRIAGIYAKVGQHVVAGTILAETENGDLVAARAETSRARTGASRSRIPSSGDTD